MTSKTLLINSVVALSLSAMASISSAACERPAKPTVPNGAEADMQTMIAGQTAVKEFVAAGEAFTACLEGEEKSASSSVDGDDADAVAEAEAVNAERIKAHNEVVDEMTAIAGEWKESMTAYNTKAAAAKAAEEGE